MAETASEWGFVRLVVGLSTALLGLLFYGKEKVLHVGWTKWLLVGSVAPLVLSLFASLWAAETLIHIDSWREHCAEYRRVNPMFMPNQSESKAFDKKLTTFQRVIRCGLILFGLGVLMAMLFFVCNTV